jgi:hypothetical protein
VVPLAGAWAGSGKLTTEGAAACQYVGGAEPPAVALQIAVSAKGDTGSGRLALVFPAAPGTSCAAIRSRASIKGMKLTESSVAFRDDQGREWNLGLKEGVLQGLFAGPGGSGEVQLKKTGAAVGGAGMSSGIVGVIAANVVGLGALYGVNKVAQDTKTGATAVTCSPRACVVTGIPGEACDCSPTLSNVVSGGNCGQTTSGLALGAACSLPDRPCQSELSCDNAVCQNPFPQGGPCPLTP